MALTPYPGESPLDFERRRQAAAGTATPAVYSPYAPLREQPKPWVDPAPAAQPAWTPEAVQRAFGVKQYGTTAATATWAPAAPGGRYGQGDRTPYRFMPAATPVGYSGWQSSGTPLPQGEMGRLLQSGGLKYDPNFAANVPTSNRPADPTQYGRLTQTPGLKYDPKRGGGDVAGYDDHGATGPGVPNPGAGVVGNLSGYQEDLENPAFLRAAVLRRLGINPTSRSGVNMWRAEKMPRLFKAYDMSTNLPGMPAVDIDARLNNFANAYQSGTLRPTLRQAGQNILGNRGLLETMSPSEALDVIGGAAQLSNYGLNPMVAQSRRRAVEDADSAYWQQQERASAGLGGSIDADLFDFFASPEGQLWAQILGLTGGR